MSEGVMDNESGDRAEVTSIGRLGSKMQRHLAVGEKQGVYSRDDMRHNEKVG